MHATRKTKILLGISLFMALSFTLGTCGGGDSKDPCEEVNCGIHGTCEAGSGSAMCVCAAGYAGERCEACEAGYHDDGTGVCVEDLSCEATTCGEHGSCDDSSGVPVCTCDAGYAGAHCEACDAGYLQWPASSGICVDDSCDPDPCTADHQLAGTCEQTSAAEHTCACETGYAGNACDECAAGYHDDGAGLCVEDQSCLDDDNCCPPDCNYRRDSDCPMCDQIIGMPAPIDPCTASDPCTRLLPTYELQNIETLDTPSVTATCTTTSRGLDLGRPAFDDGHPTTWTDSDGTARSHCMYIPPGASTTSKRPLLIYVTGSGGMANTVYDATSLRGKAESFILSGDATRTGFVLVSAQPRHLHWPTEDPQEGTKHDTFHRDLSAPSTNRDVAYYDHFIDSLVATDSIDPSRIYLMGWSNGARFAAMYGIARHSTPSPGGNRVAAVAIYSGGDPFTNVSYGIDPSCELETYPTADLPLLLISRTCDGVACDEEQDWGIVPGNVASTWVDRLRERVGAYVEWIRIDYQGVPWNGCAPANLCTLPRALLNHLHWPDGIEDEGDIDHEPEMLEFLSAHPLP